MRRWLFPLIAILGLLLSGAMAEAAPANPAATPQSLTPLPQLVRQTVVEVDLYWQHQFAAAGIPYEHAEARLYEGVTATACGDAHQGDGSFYCPKDHTIYLATHFLDDFIHPYGDYAVVQVIAHEWGHHVQVLAGTGLPATPAVTSGGAATAMAVELQADCLAGTYFGDAVHRHAATVTDVDEAITLLMEKGGDPGPIPPDARYAHGTGADRVRLFLQGYFDGKGFRGCGNLLPTN